MAVTAPPPTPDRRLLQYVDQLVESQRRLAPVAIRRGNGQAVHYCRVGTRRIRAAVDLLSPLVPAEQRKPLSRTLRKLRRRLGPLRDADVMLLHLKSLRSRSAAPAAQWMIRQLLAQRKLLHQQAAEKISPPRVLRGLGMWWSVEEAVCESGGNLDDLLRVSAGRQLGDFAQQARAMLGPAGQSSPQNWHVLRIAGKHLRYTLEMAAAAGHVLPPHTRRTFKRMQDALGLWHDYVVLTEETLRQSAKQHVELLEPALMPSVLRLIQQLHGRAASQLKLFGRLWEEHGGSLVEELAALYASSGRAGVPAEQGNGASAAEPAAETLAAFGPAGRVAATQEPPGKPLT